MIVERFRIRIANHFGDIVRERVKEYVDYSTDMTFRVSEVEFMLWQLMPKLDKSEWDLVKVGGNHRFRKLWFVSIDGQYVLYISAKKRIV